MISEKFFDRLREATPVRLYASGIDGARVYWPWRMNKADAEADSRHASQCDHYIVDSNFMDESVTNQDVLDDAHELDADVAVLADVLHDADATADALLEGLEVADDHAFDGGLLLPLQPPHVECYREVAPSAPDGVWWGVGGVKDATARRKLDAVRDLRAAVGPDAHIHGFGFGVTDQLARVVRAEPELLDSIDNSTGVQNAMTDPVKPGDERMSVVAARAQAQRIEDLRELTPHVDEETPENLRAEGQTGLEAIATDD